MGFAHLHLHTEYSLLDGSCKIGELMSRAKELGMENIAITDHDRVPRCGDIPPVTALKAVSYTHLTLPTNSLV